MTFIDIVVFMEIESVLLIYRKELPDSCPKLLRWQDQLGKEPALLSVN